MSHLTKSSFDLVFHLPSTAGIIFSHLSVSDLLACQAASHKLKASIDDLVLRRNKTSKLKSLGILAKNLLSDELPLQRLDVKVSGFHLLQDSFRVGSNIFLFTESFSGERLFQVVDSASGIARPYLQIMSCKFFIKEIFLVGEDRWVLSTSGNFFKWRFPLFNKSKHHFTEEMGEQLQQQMSHGYGFIEDVITAKQFGSVFQLVAHSFPNQSLMVMSVDANEERVTSISFLPPNLTCVVCKYSVQLTKDFLLCFCRHTKTLSIVGTGENHSQEFHQIKFDDRFHSFGHLLTEKYFVNAFAHCAGAVVEIRDLGNKCAVLQVIDLGLLEHYSDISVIESEKWIVILAKTLQEGAKAWVWSKTDRSTSKIDLIGPVSNIVQAWVVNDLMLFVEVVDQTGEHQLQTFLLPSGTFKRILAFQEPLGYLNTYQRKCFHFMEEEKMFAFRKEDSETITFISVDPEVEVNNPFLSGQEEKEEEVRRSTSVIYADVPMSQMEFY